MILTLGTSNVYYHESLTAPIFKCTQ